MPSIPTYPVLLVICYLSGLWFCQGLNSVFYKSNEFVFKNQIYSLVKCDLERKIKKESEFRMKFTLFRFVRVKGLEPPRLSSLDPKSSAATNYATRANPNTKVRIIFKIANLLGYIFAKDKEKKPISL